jgi:tetratricopeptide (TPR) repeat protein
MLAFGIFGLFVAASPAKGQNEAERVAALGQQAMADGQFSDARNYFQQLAKLQPGLAEVHATLAVIHFKLHEYENAVSEVRSAQRLNPGLPRLTSLMGLSLAGLGQFSDAVPRLEKGFKYTAEPEVRRMCGLQLLRAYTGLGKDAEAVTTSVELNKLYPDDPEVIYNTGRVYGNVAFNLMGKLHDKAPESVWTWQAQGTADEGQKDFDAAIVDFNHVLTLEPQLQGTHFRLGRIYLERFKQSQKSEDREAAKREFVAEFTVDPNNGDASYELAQMNADDKNLDDAKRQFEGVVARFPDFEQALVGLGGVYLKGQMAEKALEPLERATKLDPTDEVAWYRLAEAERAVNNREAALKADETFRTLHASGGSENKLAQAADVTPQKLGPLPKY